MSCSVHSLLETAKALAQRLCEQEACTDNIVSQTQVLHKRIESMREFQDELDSLNDAARLRPRLHLIQGIQRENRQIRELQRDNDELRCAVEEHQTALELIMSRYREQLSAIMQAQTSTSVQSLLRHQFSQQLQLKNAKILEMVGVMRAAIAADESLSSNDSEKMARLERENQALRELLAISTHFQSNIQLPETSSHLGGRAGEFQVHYESATVKKRLPPPPPLPTTSSTQASNVAPLPPTPSTQSLNLMATSSTQDSNGGTVSPSPSYSIAGNHSGNLPDTNLEPMRSGAGEHFEMTPVPVATALPPSHPINIPTSMSRISSSATDCGGYKGQIFLDSPIRKPTRNNLTLEDVEEAGLKQMEETMSLVGAGEESESDSSSTSSTMTITPCHSDREEEPDEDGEEFYGDFSSQSPRMKSLESEEVRGISLVPRLSTLSSYTHNNNNTIDTNLSKVLGEELGDESLSENDDYSGFEERLYNDISCSPSSSDSSLAPLNSSLSNQVCSQQDSSIFLAASDSGFSSSSSHSSSPQPPSYAAHSHHLNVEESPKETDIPPLSTPKSATMPSPPKINGHPSFESEDLSAVSVDSADITITEAPSDITLKIFDRVNDLIIENTIDNNGKVDGNADSSGVDSDLLGNDLTTDITENTSSLPVTTTLNSCVEEALDPVVHDTT